MKILNSVYILLMMITFTVVGQNIDSVGVEFQQLDIQEIGTNTLSWDLEVSQNSTVLGVFNIPFLDVSVNGTTVRVNDKIDVSSVNLVYDNEYTFRIKAKNSDGESDYSPPFDITWSDSVWNAADFNNDGKVDAADYALFTQEFGKFEQGNFADLDKDGKVDARDRALFNLEFGKFRDN